MHKFVQAFVETVFSVFQTSIFVGFSAVAFTVFAWVLACSLAYRLGRGDISW